MSKEIDWIEMFMNCLPDSPEGIIWTDSNEILAKTESAANTIANLLGLLYKAQGKDIVAATGHYDPDEDKRDGCQDKYTGWWYINIE